METVDIASDRDFAVALQASLDQNMMEKDGRKKSSQNKRVRDTSVVDEYWEYADPNPDIRELFVQFNDMFFDGLLAGCEVKWSPRMTLCAGLCVYEGYGGLCSIRLSQPLLKLRPRKDLVETLLHEMIHALLFVTENNKDHDGHGPQFQSHMRRINARTGANISIYHNFHAEVREYKQHWWKCTGPCQHRPPFYGMVKRAMNRAPSPRDLWWDEHRRSCDGQFVKVKEPVDYKDKKKRGKKAEGGSMLKDDGPLPKLLKKGKQESVLDASSANRIDGHFEKLSGGHRLGVGAEEKHISSTSSSGLPLHCKTNKVGGNDRECVTIDKGINCSHPLLNGLSTAKRTSCVDDDDDEVKFNCSSSLSGKEGTSSGVASTQNSYGDSHWNTVATEASTATCPICSQDILLKGINRHLDLCLTSS